MATLEIFGKRDTSTHSTGRSARWILKRRRSGLLNRNPKDGLTHLAVQKPYHEYFLYVGHKRRVGKHPRRSMRSALRPHVDKGVQNPNDHTLTVCHNAMLIFQIPAQLALQRAWVLPLFRRDEPDQRAYSIQTSAGVSPNESWQL
jgi:hypothetical protein